MLNCLSGDFAKTEILHNNFEIVVEDLNDLFCKTFNFNQNIVIFLYVGLCNSAGWAIYFNNNYTVLLGIEKIVELNWHKIESIKALIYHELCHIAHSILRGSSIDISFNNNEDNGIWQLYIEGFAQRYQQKLLGNKFYQQDTDNWLHWCENNKKEICKEYLYRLENQISTSAFFGDWNNYKGKSDVGYYLGCEHIKYLDNTYSLEQITRLSIEEIRESLFKYLKI